MCELGLGPSANNKEVKRPRLNPFLVDAGIVDFAVGGMHVLALDSENKVWSWGNNDCKVLGRDTSQKEILKPIEEDSDDDDGDLNQAESTPGKVENLPQNEGKVVQLVATDNLSALLFESGNVYAWGTFRSNEGLLGFSQSTLMQSEPKKMEHLPPVVQLAGGKDHILALDAKGVVYAWGNGQQFQLGRKIMDRHKMSALQPHQFGLYNVKYIASGDFHCFAVTHDDRVVTWGLNQYGQCGITKADGSLEDGSMVTKPTVVQDLNELNVVKIVGGEHHTLALTKKGEVYAWGRYDMKEVGLGDNSIPEYAFKDEHGKVRSIPRPTLVKFPAENIAIKNIACGSHHSFAVTKDGVVLSWGFGDTYAPGLGPLDDDVSSPTPIENTATKNIDVVLIDGGGQFSVSGGTQIDEHLSQARFRQFE